MSAIRSLIVFGTRPEAIKMAPVVREALGRPDAIETIVCLTGQHREMLHQVTDYFGLKADVDLDIMTPGQTLAQVTGRCVEAIDEVIERYQPDCILGQGDTTTVMTTALAAFYRKVPFVHVEAGLRTGNMYSPWPEEMNRRVAGLITGLHCPPTERARDNLLSEGVDPAAVHVTGNTVIDALLWTVERERERDGEWCEKHQFGDSRVVLITGHRRENFGAGFQDMCRAIRTLAERYSETLFVYPVHLNPKVQEPVHSILGELQNVRLLPPAP
ncbi:MAG: UDP-N-acetylglucosamine 2-epimerase (non-hydrolyzing) [Planctomycetaceae bacterium]